MIIFLKRAYDPPAATDGVGVLVDRLWPRGLSKSSARIDIWRKDLAPSVELRKWYGHEPAKWPEFQKRYRAELRGNPALLELRALSSRGDVTLVYASKDELRNNALVLKQVLGRGT